MRTNSKYRVFLGSSTEGLSVAEVIALRLEHVADVTIWDQGIFQLGKGTLESLVEAVAQFDFAVMVLSPDDVVTTRGDTELGPRDNVLFELGLFMGALGQARTFMLFNRDTPPRLPTDLKGIAAATYSEREDGNLEAAVGTAATRLKITFNRLGHRTQRAAMRHTPEAQPSVYWCAPHKNRARNKQAGAVLESHGIAVLMPFDLVRKRAANLTTQPDRKLVRETCIAAILKSDMLVVDLDTYGLDSAWEVGFGEAKGTPIVGFSIDQGKIVEARTVRRRPYTENFMHGWDACPVYESIDQLLPACRGRSVYVCGPFRNESAMQALRESCLRQVASRLILPKDLIDVGNAFPQQYPWGAREQAIDMLADSEIALVILPRYGMDTSWQLGYAAGLNKELIGWLGPPGGPELEEAPIWDHWMHGWKEKLTTTRLSEIAAVVRGFSQVGLLKPSVR
jgi:nucleoside 2-deoxyribosyltransferase